MDRRIDDGHIPLLLYPPIAIRSMMMNCQGGEALDQLVLRDLLLQLIRQELVECRVPFALSRVKKF